MTQLCHRVRAKQRTPTTLECRFDGHFFLKDVTHPAKKKKEKKEKEPCDVSEL